MGLLQPAPPSLLIVAAFSRHLDALEWAETELTLRHGPIALREEYAFDHTRYYEKEMGPNLRKWLLAFERLTPSDSLSDLKHFTNDLEAQLAAEKKFPESRPVNLDPGLLQLGKFLLATTKDKDHRIYIGNGIYAEVTLRFEDGGYHPWPWTYADYREQNVRDFLRRARDFYRPRLANAREEASATVPKAAEGTADAKPSQ